MEKYKEISNKGNENLSKSQRNLDSLLKIPFNVYKKEKILCDFDNFANKIIIIINFLEQFFKDNNYENDKNLYELQKLVDYYKIKQKLLFDDIITFITKLKKINTKIIYHYIDITELDYTYIDILVNTYVTKNKNKQIIEFIKIIDEQHNHKLKEKNNKMNYKKEINAFFKDEAINKNIKKILYHIQNNQHKQIINLYK